MKFKDALQNHFKKMTTDNYTFSDLGSIGKRYEDNQ